MQKLTRVQEFVQLQNREVDLSQNVGVRYFLTALKAKYSDEYWELIGEVLGNLDIDMAELIDDVINYECTLRRIIVDTAKQWISQTLADIEEIKADNLKKVENELEDCCDIFKRSRELKG